MNKTSKSFQLRQYNHAHDRSHVVSICSDLFGGQDWVSGTLHLCAKERRNRPYVLCSAEGNSPVSFINIRELLPDDHVLSLTNKSHGKQKTESSAVKRFHAEGLRVSDKRWGEGIGTTTLCRALDQVRTDERGTNSCQDVVFTAVTTQENAAMKAIFNRTGWMPISGCLHIWPSRSDIMQIREHIKQHVDDDGERTSTINFFQFFNIPISDVEDNGNDDVNSKMKTHAWTRVQTAAQIQVGIQALCERGASGFLPGYYNADCMSDAIRFLDVEVAMQEQRAVWQLQKTTDFDDDSRHGLLALIFCRPIIIDEQPVTPHNFVGACAVTQWAAEECIRFVVNDLGMSDFQMAFDTTVTSDMFQLSSVLRCSEARPFKLFEHREK